MHLALERHALGAAGALEAAEGSLALLLAEAHEDEAARTAALAYLGAVSESEGVARLSGRVAEAQARTAESEVDTETGVSVWPNPAAGAATVSLALPESAEQVRLVLYDALGREVAVLHDGPLAAGAHEVSLDAAGLAPGAYVVRAEGVAAPPTRLTVLR